MKSKIFILMRLHIYYSFLVYLGLIGQIYSFIDDILVNINTQAFIDSHNRERYFHGTNVVLKTFPWYPDGKNGNTFDESDIKYLKRLGMNIVRLGVMWAGVMPTLGHINYTYLDEVKMIVVKLQQHGIFTLLDSHQDIFSEEFCGNGFPRLHKNTRFPMPIAFPFKYDGNPPTVEQCAKHYWPIYYESFGAINAFEDLYTNKRNLTNYYTMFWEEVTKYFRGIQGVIGYNLINEPYPGNIFKKPYLLIDKIANKRILKFQDTVAKGVRKHDNKKIIFFEGITFTFFGTGFTYVPGGKDYRNRSCLSYHYYKPPNISPQITVNLNEESARMLKTGRMLTEFFSHSKVYNERYKIWELLRVANSKLHSWISWQYKCFTQPNQNSDECDTFNRDQNNDFPVDIKTTYQIYPMVIAGQTKSFYYKPQIGRFYLEYEVSDYVKRRESIIFGGVAVNNLKSISTCSLVTTVDEFYYVIEHADCIPGTKIIVTN